jgi:hypothetical protein
LDGGTGDTDKAIIRINEAKGSPKRKNLTKQINVKCNNIGSADEKKNHCSNFFLCEKLKSRSFLSSSSQSLIFSCVLSVSPAALNTV